MYMFTCHHITTVMLACSSCRLCRNDSVSIVVMMILGPLWSKPLSNFSSSLMLQYLLAVLDACLHVAGHALCLSV